MKYVLYATAALLASTMAVPAMAQVTLETNEGQLKTLVYSDDDIDANPNVVYGTTAKNDPARAANVKFTADTAISMTQGGFALIEDADGAKGIQDFYQLTIDPTFDFTQIDFSLQFNAANAYFTVEYDLAGDGTDFVFFPTTQYQGSGLADYLLSGNGLVFDAIRITSVDGALTNGRTSIKFEKQNSFTLASGAVPEPSVWAMMLIGFGALGSQIRRRRVGTAGLLRAFA